MRVAQGQKLRAHGARLASGGGVFRFDRARRSIRQRLLVLGSRWWAPLSSRYSSTNTSLSLSISAFLCQRTQWGRPYVLALRCRVLALLGDFPFLCPNVLIQSLIASALIRAGSSSVSHQSLATSEVSQLYFSEAPMLFPCAALPAPLSSPGG